MLQLLRLGLQRLLLPGNVGLGLVGIALNLFGDILADLGLAQNGLTVDQKNAGLYLLRRRIGGQCWRHGGGHECEREKGLFHRLRILFRRRSGESGVYHSWS